MSTLRLPSHRTPAADHAVPFDERARRAAVARAAVPPIPKPQPAPQAKLRVGRRSELRRLLDPVPLPAVFVGEIRPLALGINEGLRALLPAATSYGEALALEKKRAAIVRWLRDFTARPEYLAALAAPGSQRHALDGAVVGDVSEAHREHAALRLAEASATP